MSRGKPGIRSRVFTSLFAGWVPLLVAVLAPLLSAGCEEPGLDFSEEFVLLGSQGEQTITAGELARRRNTIAWEVLTSMAQRLARVYHPSAGTAGVDPVA